jgi:uncharacterized flavoprotein (TIGR03862 family)
VRPQKRIAIIGSGPSGLMAATQLLDPSVEIHLYEKRAGYGRKLLIAGSSGLNISHHLGLEGFASQYRGWDQNVWREILTQFKVEDWLAFIEKKLGLETFLGTSDRYFVREMKASNLLKRWIGFLETQGVIFHPQAELSDFAVQGDQVSLHFGERIESFDAAAFFLGGGSWEDSEPLWLSLFRRKGLEVVRFEPSNVGYEVDWPAKFIEESEGKPLKKLELKTSRGKKLGELVVTKYGLEGTPIYFCGTPGQATLDLKPDLSVEQLLRKLKSGKENLAPIRRVKRFLALGPAAESLLFHFAPDAARTELDAMAAAIKALPIELKRPRSLSESISSSGGLSLSELTPDFELKKFSGIYCGGEMLDWDAPTGGFLIQACVSQGAWIGKTLPRRFTESGR